MTLYSWYGKHEPKLNWVYSRRALYKSKLEYGLAKQRLLAKFGAGPVNRIVDEVC